MIKQENDDLYDFIQFYRCDYGCDSHMLRVTKFKDEPMISVSKFHNDSQPSLFQRIYLAVMYIFNPDKFDIYGDIIFSEKTIQKLGRDLLSISSQKIDPRILIGSLNKKNEPNPNVKAPKNELIFEGYKPTPPALRDIKEDNGINFFGFIGFLIIVFVECYCIFLWKSHG